MAYAVGGISGGHFNPAVSVGLATAGRFSWRDLPGYGISQVPGGTAGALIFYLIASRKADFSTAGGFVSNGFGEHSPGGYSMLAALISEVVMMAFFLIIILGTTGKKIPAGFAPIAIGLGLTLIHLISIPVTNTSVNPARSTAVALFTGGRALEQLWLFWVAPIAGAVIGALVHSNLLNNDE